MAMKEKPMSKGTSKEKAMVKKEGRKEESKVKSVEKKVQSGRAGSLNKSK